MGRDLYDTDFYSWTAHQAEALRAGRFDRVDVGHLVEEVESLGRSEAAALRSSYRLIVTHLLKMRHQPRKATASPDRTIYRERLNVETCLADNPGLKPRRAVLFAQAYALARREAAFETGLPLATFPEAPAFDLDAVESTDSWPPGFPLAAR